MIVLDYRDRRPLYEQVAERLQEMMFNGVLPQDAQLPSVRSLATDLSIKPNTIQRAYAELERQGFIYSIKGKGSFVVVDGSELESGEEETEAYNEQFINSTNARILLEPSVVKEIAVTATDEELKAIAGCIGSKGYEDGEFHRSIIAATHNPVLLQWFDQLNSMETSPAIRSLVPPVRQKSVAAKIAQQHQDISDALMARNGEFAYFYMKEHLVFIRDTYQEYFKVFY